MPKNKAHAHSRAELCQSVAGVTLPQHLRSTTRRLLVVQLPAQLLWLTGFVYVWSVSLEFPAGQLVGSGYWWEQF